MIRHHSAFRSVCASEVCSPQAARGEATRLSPGPGVCLLVALFATISCGETFTGADPPQPPPRTIRVPSEAPTIQAALDSARTGDTALVAAGVYSGDGNRDLDFSGKAIALVSESGAAQTIIDCQGDSALPHGGITFAAGEDNAVVDGFTIQNGFASLGAALSMHGSSPTIKNCVLANNHSTVSGGAVRCKNSSPRLVNCTFVGNSSVTGGGMFLIAGSSPVIENCIIANSTNGAAVVVSGSDCHPVFTCALIFGNSGGDWSGAIADQATASGNLSADPLFCNPANDLRLQPGSPALGGNNSCGVQIGALGEGCVGILPPG